MLINNFLFVNLSHRAERRYPSVRTGVGVPNLLSIYYQPFYNYEICIEGSFHSSVESTILILCVSTAERLVVVIPLTQAVARV